MSENKIDNNKLLIGISCILVGVGYLLKLFDIPYCDVVILMGFYFFYKSVTELSTIRHPNLYKVVIVIVVMVFVTISVSMVSNAYVSANFWAGFGKNFGENINVLVDAIIKIIDYIKVNKT